MGTCDPKGCYSIASVEGINVSSGCKTVKVEAVIPMMLVPVYQTTGNCISEKQSLQLVARESHCSRAVGRFLYFVLFYFISLYLYVIFIL
jgi:hypothetical protein